MTREIQRTMAICGAAFVLLLFPSIIMIGLLPPMSPLRTADQVAQFWSTNTGLKRVGLVIMLAAAGLQAPFGALMAVRIRQMEGTRYSALAYTQLVGTGLAVVAILMPTFAFAAASYRPERNPEITQALNDLGWLPFVMNWPAATIQCVVIGFAIFGAKTAVWPRWLGYFNVWCAFIFAAGGLVVLFKDGVFAWNGLLAFWLVAVFFGVWFLVMSWQLWVTASSEDESRTAEGVLAS
ncbi:hypothetical protein FHT40_005798 [Mycolicibacterium sp. BK556]|uniref:hypothetical protein n=1 Tax=Mycobacteriaceae TaxID=1762 RepID=UPI00105F8B29|nr:MULTISPECIES: hypothetical protein [Mycobacteriaceae]MBB3606109.1 hypothetical protein [Mycolicibacterium sp. BK556]MBB3632686.1 hypothetical protein [Mycolicibacterium sp. BK607]TDO17989.1 hypothetical protein EV580_1168 [Mycobacterium sp. BK086]